MHHEYQRETLALIVNYVQLILRGLGRNYPVVFAFVAMIYLPVIHLDYMTFDQIGDCDTICGPSEKTKPRPLFVDQLAVTLDKLVYVDPFDILSSHSQDPETQHTSPLGAPFVSAHDMIPDNYPTSGVTHTPSHVYEPNESSSSSSSSSPPYDYFRQESVVKCLKETNDCDVIVSFAPADLSSLPPPTDPKYWPKGFDPENDEPSHNVSSRASMLQTRDLVALLQSHALNLTLSAQYLLKNNYSTLNDYTWIHPTLRVTHMTTELLEKLEQLKELKTLEMNFFKVEYSSASASTSPSALAAIDNQPFTSTAFLPLQEASGSVQCILNYTVCNNCYFENGRTKSPCVTEGEPGFVKINCTEAFHKGVKFNGHLMRSRALKYCIEEEKDLPPFTDFETIIDTGVGRSDTIPVPNLDKASAPDYLIDMLGSDAATLLTENVRSKLPVIASLDSGVNLNHETIREAYRGYVKEGPMDHKNNWYSYYGDPAPVDVRNHGTPVLSTALGGYTDPSSGDYVYLGASAKRAQWIAATCDSGSIHSKQQQLCYFHALEWLLKLSEDGIGADVVLIPLIGDSEEQEMFPSLYESIDKLTRYSLIVTSLGRPKVSEKRTDWCYSLSHPASFANVITVGAVTSNKKHSFLSAAGGIAKARIKFTNTVVQAVKKPELVAYGEGITAAWAGDSSIRRGLGGTSFSAGLVAGVLAQLKAKYDRLNLDNFRDAFKQSCAKLENPESPHDNLHCPLDREGYRYFGAGLLDATALDRVLHTKQISKIRAAKNRGAGF